MEETSTPNYQKLTERAFTFLQQERKILLFPILGMVIATLLLALVIAFLYFLIDLRNVAVYVALIIIFFYLIVALINIFANAVLIIWSYSRLTGENLTTRESFKRSLKHTKKLFVWGLAWGAIMMILNLIQSEYQRRFGYTIPESIGFTFLGITWTFATYFVLPVMLIENKSIKQAVARSALIFSKTWVKNLAGQLKIGFRLLPWIFVALIPTILAILMPFIAPDSFREFLLYLERALNIDAFAILFSSAVGLTIIIIGLAGLVFLTLQQIFFTVIYYYEKQGEDSGSSE